jgi:LysR family hydrogen peroxide-inducible transcriptional activator
MMLLEEGHCMRNQALEFCSIIGSLEKQDFRASSLETLIEMIKTGNGITLIPKIAAKKDRRISFIKIENPPIREISLYYRKNSVNKDLFEKLARIVIEKIGK